MNKYPSQDNNDDDIQDKNGTNEKEDNLIKNGANSDILIKNGGNDNVDKTSNARADLDGVNMENGEDTFTTKRKLLINFILVLAKLTVMFS